MQRMTADFQQRLAGEMEAQEAQRRQQGKEDKDNEISVEKYEMKSNLSRV